MNKPPRISSYKFGHIEIDGQGYTSDVIILPGGVKPDWRRAEGHALRPGDLTAVLGAAPEVLVIGQGEHGYMKVADETVVRLRDGIGAHSSGCGKLQRTLPARPGCGGRVASDLLKGEPTRPPQARSAARTGPI